MKASNGWFHAFSLFITNMKKITYALLLLIVGLFSSCEKNEAIFTAAEIEEMLTKEAPMGMGFNCMNSTYFYFVKGAYRGSFSYDFRFAKKYNKERTGTLKVTFESSSFVYKKDFIWEAIDDGVILYFEDNKKLTAGIEVEAASSFTEMDGGERIYFDTYRLTFDFNDDPYVDYIKERYYYLFD